MILKPFVFNGDGALGHENLCAFRITSKVALANARRCLKLSESTDGKNIMYIFLIFIDWNPLPQLH
jgi:hypothetical protein